MRDVLFASKLLSDGHLLCPKKYADPRAEYKVIVSMPDEIAADSDIESATATDACQDDALTAAELDYYLHLNEVV